MCVEARWRSSSLSGLSRGVCVVCTWLALALSLLLSLSCSFCTCSSGFSRALSHTHFHTHCRSVTLAFLLLALKQVARLSCQFFVNQSSSLHPQFRPFESNSLSIADHPFEPIILPTPHHHPSSASFGLITCSRPPTFFTTAKLDAACSVLGPYTISRSFSSPCVLCRLRSARYTAV